VGLNILELCLSPDLGGLELFVVGCYKSFNTHIAVSPNSKLDNYIDGEKFYAKRNKFFPIIPALKLAKYIDNNSIDIIHFHWNKDIITAVLAKLLSKRKPKVVQTRNMHITRYKNDFYHRWLYKNINGIHAVTQETKERLEKYIPQDVQPKFETIYMGTEVGEIEKKDEKLLKKYEINESDFIVGIVGRIEEAKGQFLLIEAVNKLRDLNIKALIVGHTMDESYLKNLKNRVKELSLEDKIIFTGFTKEVSKHFALMDVAILATTCETFGLVVIEAMANGVLVIATNRCGPTEVIQEGVDGLFFDRTAEDLAKKIKSIYDDKEFKERLSLNAYKKVKEKFNNKLQFDKLYSFLEKL